MIRFCYHKLSCAPPRLSLVVRPPELHRMVGPEDWPFGDPMPEMRDIRSLHLARDFFRAALAGGFTPHVQGIRGVGASAAAGLSGIVDYRGGSRDATRWGLILFRRPDEAVGAEDRVFGAAIADFGVGCEAVLRWLRGEPAEAICALVRDCLWRDAAGSVSFGCWPGAGECPGRVGCRAAAEAEQGAAADPAHSP